MIAVNIAVVSFVFIPYMILVMLGNRDYKKIDQNFHEEVRKNNLKIDFRDRWNLNAIGLDSHQEKLLLVQRRDHDFFIDLLDLKNFKTSSLLIQRKMIKINGQEELLLQKIDLELLHLNGEEKVLLSFFDHDFHYDQDYEIKHAEKWRDLINSLLNSRPMFQNAA